MDDNESNEKPKAKRGTEEGPPPTQFSDLMGTISSGEFDANVTKKLRQLIEAVEETGGSGKLTVTIAVKKEKRMLVVKPGFKATLPELGVDSDMFFVDENSRLTKSDPKQMRIKFASPKGGGTVIDLSGKKPKSPEPKTPEE